MESSRCCGRYAQDETANLTYMCSYGYTVPMHQISSLETKYSARISAGGQIEFWSTRWKCGQRNRTSSPKTGHFRMHLRDTYAGTFSVGPRPGHANCERVSVQTTFRGWPPWEYGYTAPAACGARAGPSHMVNLVKSRSTFKRLGSDTCLYWRAVVTLPFLFGES
jgi:hypothetical protein